MEGILIIIVMAFIAVYYAFVGVCAVYAVPNKN